MRKKLTKVRELNTEIPTGVSFPIRERSKCKNCEARRATFASRRKCTEERVAYAEKTRGKVRNKVIEITGDS